MHSFGFESDPCGFSLEVNGREGEYSSHLGIRFFATFGTMLEEVYARWLLHWTGFDQCVKGGDPCSLEKGDFASRSRGPALIVEGR